MIVIFLAMQIGNANASAPVYSDTYIPKLANFKATGSSLNGKPAVTVDFTITTHLNPFKDAGVQFGFPNAPTGPLVKNCLREFHGLISEVNLKTLTSTTNSDLTTTEYQAVIPLDGAVADYCRGSYVLYGANFQDIAGHNWSVSNRQFWGFQPTSEFKLAQESNIWTALKSFPCSIVDMQEIEVCDMNPVLFQDLSSVNIDVSEEFLHPVVVHSPSPTATLMPVLNNPAMNNSKILNWVCIKGKSVLKKSGAKVSCPTGYKKK